MNQPPNHEGMSVIVKTVTRWVKSFILLFGIYIVLYGHLTPGGGFAGGVIVACAFILLTLAEGQRVAFKTLGKTAVSELDSVGALIFWGLAVTGMIVAGTFFRNFITTPETSYFKLLSSGTILPSNIGIGLKVGMSLFLVFAMLSALHVAVRKDGRREMIRRRRDKP